MNYLSFVIIGVLLLAMWLFAQRNRRRQVAEAMVRDAQIGVGTEIMTTSGLYGTVVARNDDDTAMISIAPGVEVKFALAALRDAASVAERYRKPLLDDADGSEDGVGDADEAPEGDPAGETADQPVQLGKPRTPRAPKQRRPSASEQVEPDN